MLDYEEMLDEIIECYEEGSLGNFDPDFVYDVKEQIDEGRELSMLQEQSIENIYEGFHIADILS